MTAEAIDTTVAFERERDTQAWARWLGRAIDQVLLLPFVFGIFVALAAAVEVGRLPYEFIAWVDNPILATIGEITISLLLTALWEPLFISNTSTTPGKWIMGVRVKRADGRNVGLLTAFGRYFWVYAVGLGLGIPLVAFICIVVAHIKLISDGVTAWDEGLKLTVLHKKRHVIVWTLAFIIVIGVNITFAVLSRMPA